MPKESAAVGYIDYLILINIVLFSLVSRPSHAFQCCVQRATLKSMGWPEYEAQGFIIIRYIASMTITNDSDVHSDLLKQRSLYTYTQLKQVLHCLA